MTFVYPLLLGGLLLAGLPVLLHFLNRQKPKTLLFPAFRFLVQKRQSNTRNLRLRHLLLLLLRIGLIALVCLALARPRLFQEQLAGLLDRERPVAMIFVFDTTPSMGYKVGEQTRLDLARQRALELLDQLPADGRFLVLDAADLASAEREDFASADKARQRIQSLVVRPESVPVTTGLIKALDRFDAWDDPLAQNLPRFVCVFSDRTRPAWDGVALRKRPTKEDAIQVQTLFFDVGAAEPIDFAITQADFSGDRQSFLQGEKVPLRVVVSATGKSAAGAIQIKMAGRKPLEQAVTVAAGEQQAVTFDIDTDKLGAGFNQVEIVEPTADALAFNNRRFVTFKIQERPKILVLADDLPRSKRFATSLEDLVYTVDHKTPKDAGNLGQYQAVFLVSVAVPDEALWQELKSFVDAGGGLAVVPGGEEMQPKGYRSEHAKKLLPGEYVGVVESKQGAVWDVLQSNLAHSFMQPFRAWAQRGSIEFIDEPRRAFKYWAVKPINSQAVVVVYDDNARPAVLERQLANGKIVMLTTPLDERTPEWNNYGDKLTTFRLALTLMCARHLCSEAQKQSLNFEFGVQPPRVAKGIKPFAKYSVGADQSTEDITFDGQGRWRGDRLMKAGNYTIWGTNPDQPAEVVAKFSLNTPGSESDLTHVPREEIEAMLGKDAVIAQDRKTPLSEALNWNEPLELFPWLMISILFLLAFENLLANRFYRQEAPA